MEIIIMPDAHQVALRAADVYEGYATEGATLGLATGSTPLAMYRELIRRHREEGLSFAQCRAFLLDEYVGLPRTHEQSYYATIRNEFTSHIDIDDTAVKSPDGTAPDVTEAGKAYDAAIKEAGGVDIQLLGIGTDGHIGFNEPGSSLRSRTRLKTLHPQTIKDNARFFESEDEVPIHVLTQGLGTISEARHLLLLATGTNKAQAVRDFVEGPLASVCPASVLQLHNHATVIVDEEAASLLEHADYYRFAFDHNPAWKK
ncbi:glucosamine-6-phosphate deaminase [Corynebacterium sp. ES2794-CONJ1]|uniref:glucosamine-6-phosphate deaminase n=1 Tax=unclassified Corynebacterium TaxID=2624378 RepID=UPI0021672759|nr:MULTISPECIES: glucosamine-6-phosphate deaminase [unclassified Corynebacterium]MCS4489988.1 glucosamine-6-phosphate deaminase [Corynebacterium sp. ES2775-CONJ]MCS4491649.1 glucosamine-6-phosphate deaminase [Corynebacterium sp. ES2715-CONJ3]MCS4531754.1 glucosamine-6-phosphate deaminase [Corynebacterium sp. ES2730-CONJ]MCU9519150.1 glucosamine-6-phosphate deaminase [Corynebacterium sp. ES2794-CONJ1]